MSILRRRNLKVDMNVAKMRVLSSGFPAAAADVPAPRRYLGIDLVRVASCIGIIWFHAKAPGGEYAHAGLPALMLLSVALAAEKTDRSPKEIIAKRFQRLIVPWLVWSALYLLVALVKLALGKNVFSWYMLATGPSPHLWFLPAAFVMGSAAGLLASASEAGRFFRWWVVATAISIPAVGWLRMQVPAELVPLPQWLLVLPTVTAGMALATLQPSTSRVMRRLGLLIGAYATALAICHQLRIQDALLYFIGLAVPSLAWQVRVRGPRWLNWLALITFAVYLVHPAVMTLINAGSTRKGLGFALVTIIASLASAALLWKTPLRRFA